MRWNNPSLPLPLLRLSRPSPRRRAGGAAGATAVVAAVAAAGAEEADANTWTEAASRRATGRASALSRCANVTPPATPLALPLPLLRSLPALLALPRRRLSVPAWSDCMARSSLSRSNDCRWSRRRSELFARDAAVTAAATAAVAAGDGPSDAVEAGRFRDCCCCCCSC